MPAISRFHGITIRMFHLNRRSSAVDYLVVEARYVGAHTVWLRFRDRSTGEIDLTPELHGEVFEPLQDPEYFRHFRIEGGALEWPNGASFAPEFLHDNIRVTT